MTYIFHLNTVKHLLSIFLFPCHPQHLLLFLLQHALVSETCISEVIGILAEKVTRKQNKKDHLPTYTPFISTLFLNCRANGPTRLLVFFSAHKLCLHRKREIHANFVWPVEFLWLQWPGGAASPTTLLTRPTDSKPLKVSTNSAQGVQANFCLWNTRQKFSSHIRCNPDRAFTQLMLWQN